MYCSVAECDGKSIVKGFCSKHYERYRKYGDPLAYHRVVWTEGKIEREIAKCQAILMLERMPSKSELGSIQRLDLDNAIARSKGYRGWAKHLNLSLKKSETALGQKYEYIAMELLKMKGFTVEKMSTRFPYDLLVADKVKIDVKCARRYKIGDMKYHTFGINKKHQTCDVYILFLLNEDGNHTNILVIPSHFIKVKTLTFNRNSKWYGFEMKWSYINKYMKFYESIS